MKYLKNAPAIILCCGAPLFGLLWDGISYLVVKNDPNLHQSPPFLGTIIFTVLALPVLIASLQFVELTDEKLIDYLFNIKLFEIKVSNIEQWGYFYSRAGCASYPFIYISTKNFPAPQFNFSKIGSRKYKYIKCFPHDQRLEKWLKQNVPYYFL